MRICHPREAGMDAPSRLFWPFVEGFEHGTQGWRLVDKSSSAASLGTDSVAKSGYCSLKVSIPRGQHSATLASTRFRGWLIEEKEATGFRLWLRTKSGTGDALFTLHSDAFTTNQISSPCVSQVTISNQWQHADLFFEQFPALPVGDIDWLTIEFRGKGPIDFLLDDVQLLGPWILDPE
jgi:hypothetical protein